MARNIEKIAESLFEKIRARFKGVSVGDNQGKVTTDPTQARFFNFDFIDKAGNNFGNVTISLINEEGVKVYFGKNLSANLDESQKAEWYDFLRDLRMFAMRNLLKFDTRDISRSQLDIKDIQQQAKTERPLSVEDSLVAEGKLYGTSKTSYESIGPGTRLIIRHSAPVDEAIHGARGRKIHAVYIEDTEGQRFKSPFTNLLGSRVLARHIDNGGQINDDFSKHVSEMCEEMGKIRNFIKGSRNKTFEDVEANEMVNAAKDRYQTLHQMLGKLKNPKGYKFYKDSWKPASTLQDDINLEELKSKFVLKDFDNRLEAALPHVYRAYHAHKGEEMNKPAIDNHIDQFKESLDRISEGSWALPDNDLAVKKLQDLMSDVLPAGIDGTDATGALYNILGDDELFDDIYDASKGSPDVDVRPIIYDWLQNNMPSVFEKVKGDIESGHEEPESEEPETEEPESEEPETEEPESEESETPDEFSEDAIKESNQLSIIRKLAGLKKNILENNMNASDFFRKHQPLFEANKDGKKSKKPEWLTKVELDAEEKEGKKPKNVEETAANFFRKYSDIVKEAEGDEEAVKCPICKKTQKENTEGNPKYCQGH